MGLFQLPKFCGFPEGIVSLTLIAFCLLAPITGFIVVQHHHSISATAMKVCDILLAAVTYVVLTFAATWGLGFGFAFATFYANTVL